MAARQWSVLDVADLAACGLSRQAISKRVRAGRLFVVHRGVYAVGHPNLSLEGRFLAAVKACGVDAALSHHASAALNCMLPWDYRFLPEVTAPTRRSHPGIYTHMSKNIERTYRMGIPVTTAARTLIDLASVLSLKKLRRAANAALTLNLIEPKDLLVTHSRGAKQLREILATAAPTFNEFEDVVHALTLGLPALDVNLRFDGYVPDLRWPEHNLVVEADSRQFHNNPLARADDIAKDKAFDAQGERVLRITWAQATRHPLQTRARIEAALNRAC